MLEIQRNAEIVNAATMQEIKKKHVVLRHDNRAEQNLSNAMNWYRICRDTGIYVAAYRCNLYCSIQKWQPGRGGSVVWGTTLKAGKWRVRIPLGSLVYFKLSGSIMAVAYQVYFLGVKAVGVYSWRYHFRILIILKSGSQPPEAEGIALHWQ